LYFPIVRAGAVLGPEEVAELAVAPSPAPPRRFLAVCADESTPREGTLPLSLKHFTPPRIGPSDAWRQRVSDRPGRAVGAPGRGAAMSRCKRCDALRVQEPASWRYLNCGDRGLAEEATVAYPSRDIDVAHGCAYGAAM
jgi:hypothetical protein